MSEHEFYLHTFFYGVQRKSWIFIYFNFVVVVKVSMLSIEEKKIKRNIEIECRKRFGKILNCFLNGFIYGRNKIVMVDMCILPWFLCAEYDHPNGNITSLSDVPSTLNFDPRSFGLGFGLSLAWLNFNGCVGRKEYSLLFNTKQSPLKTTTTTMKMHFSCPRLYQ